MNEWHYLRIREGKKQRAGRRTVRKHQHFVSCLTNTQVWFITQKCYI